MPCLLAGLPEQEMQHVLAALLPMQASALLDLLVQQQLLRRVHVAGIAPGPPAILRSDQPRAVKVSLS